jgi:hypothetical protein
VHYFSEFFAIAMRLSLNTTRAWGLLAALVSCAGWGAWGQESSGQDSSGKSLGEVARKTRQERSAPGHVPARKVAAEDFDGPDASGVWRMRLCTITPCYELSIALPKTPKWSRAAQEPRPVLIPVSGHEEDSSRVIRVYAGESSDPKYFLDDFKRMFLQAWFARPEYFGQSAQLLRDEHVPIDWSTGTITHFTITTAVLKYRGSSVVAGSNQGNFGFACVFREEDSAVGSSICDAVVKSARYQELQSSFVRKVYPPDDPPDAPGEDDPQ